MQKLFSNTKKRRSIFQLRRFSIYGNRLQKRSQLCVQIRRFRQSLDDVYQELQQSGSIVTVDLAVLIVAVTVQSLLCVESQLRLQPSCSAEQRQ